MVIGKEYRNCHDCGKEKYLSSEKLCRECKRQEIIHSDSRNKQKITMKDFVN